MECSRATAMASLVVVDNYDEEAKIFFISSLNASREAALFILKSKDLHTHQLLLGVEGGRTNTSLIIWRKNNKHWTIKDTKTCFFAEILAAAAWKDGNLVGISLVDPEECGGRHQGFKFLSGSHFGYRGPMLMPQHLIDPKHHYWMCLELYKYRSSVATSKQCWWPRNGQKKLNLPSCLLLELVGMQEMSTCLPVVWTKLLGYYDIPLFHIWGTWDMEPLNSFSRSCFN